MFNIKDSNFVFLIMENFAINLTSPTFHGNPFAVLIAERDGLSTACKR